MNFHGKNHRLIKHRLHLAYLEAFESSALCNLHTYYDIEKLRRVIKYTGVQRTKLSHLEHFFHYSADEPTSVSNCN